jgi:hypothetical protein
MESGHSLELYTLRALSKIYGQTAFGAGKQNPAGSEVLVQQADGTLRVVWTYGNDTPPS